ncbi:hypothetical protein [Mangrovibacter plantisponsor]|uniref:Uncharacterized protein n=1 Tax=Mangrovibacter plantisponsor TaxID=451513 RepID=A0A317PXC1_9ENTR|nr:hypothetical protein [Mangrovibacter plantisponsor]PWW07821.1 hypothetical protein DES37_108249 [Mangrovibacter plantisponsor]
MVMVLKVTANDRPVLSAAEFGNGHQRLHYVQHIQRMKDQAMSLSSRTRGALVGKHLQFERVYIDEGAKSVVYEFIAPALTGENVQSISGAELSQLEKEGADYSHQSVRNSDDIWFLISLGWRVESCLLTQEGIILVDDIFNKQDIL